MSTIPDNPQSPQPSPQPSPQAPVPEPVWHVRKDGRQFGPFTLQDLQGHVHSGHLLRGDYVRAPGMNDWVQAWTVPALFGPVNVGASGNGLGDIKGLEWVLPVKTSIWAILGGYFGLFSVLLLPAPIALVLGIIAIVDLRRHPDRHGWGRAIFAVVMGALFTLLLAFVAVLIAFDA